LLSFFYIASNNIYSSYIKLCENFIYIFYYILITYILFIHGKNGFGKISENLARYKSENFIRQNNYVGSKLKLIARMSKLFAALLIMSEHLT